MTLNDPLANALSTIWNAEKVGKLNCTVTPSSILIKSVLLILKKNSYISDFKETRNKRGIKIWSSCWIKGLCSCWIIRKNSKSQIRRKIKTRRFIKWNKRRKWDQFVILCWKICNGLVPANIKQSTVNLLAVLDKNNYRDCGFNNDRTLHTYCGNYTRQCTWESGENNRSWMGSKR